MNDERIHKYEWGQRVVAGTDLFNDGSYPDHDADALLVACGSVGEVVQVGMHLETDRPVYLVQFSDRCVVGCIEDEIEVA